MELLPSILKLGIAAQAGGAKIVNRMARFLKFVRDHLIRLNRCDGKRDHRGRHILIQEGAGHGVLTADGGCVQTKLCVQCAQQRLEGLAPAGRLISQLLEKLLQRQVGFLVICTGSHDLGHRGNYAGLSAQIGIGGQQLRVTAPGHNAGVIGVLTGQHRQLRCHGLCGGGLVLSTEGHQHRASADGSVEALHQASLGGKA